MTSHSTVAEELACFDVDPLRGFVPAEDPRLAMSGRYAQWDEVASELPLLLMGGRLRQTLRRMPVLEGVADTSKAEQERALLLLTAFASAWVWGERDPDLVIPRGVAEPLIAVARSLDRLPIGAHGTVVLGNWRRLDRTKPLALDNVDTLVDFLGGVDEKWFFLATLGCELAGAPILPLLVSSIHASAASDDDSLAQDLGLVALHLRGVIDAFMRVREWCDPHVFFHRVRPFLTGWPAPGVVYEGTGVGPVQLSGGSAAQSALLQAIDAALSIGHVHALTKPFLDGMQDFMPPPHRRFLAHLRETSSVRAKVEAPGAPAAVRDAYNDCVVAMDELRRRHMGLATDYITKQAPPADQGLGTGGTSFVDFLRESRLETGAFDRRARGFALRRRLSYAACVRNDGGGAFVSGAA